MRTEDQYTDRGQRSITFLILFAAALAVGRILLVLYRGGMLYTFGIFYLVVFIGIYGIVKKALLLREVFFSVWVRILLAMFFTGFQVLGICYSVPGVENSVSTAEILLWILCLTPLVYGVQNMLFAWVARQNAKLESSKGQGGGKEDDFSVRKSFRIAYAVILAGFLIPFATYYPAIMAYDVIPQLDQIKISGYTTHHPLIHTLMLALSLKAGEILPFVDNADRAGLAIYTVLQMLIVAGCFAYVYVYLRQRKVPKYVCAFFILCVAFYPTHGMLAVSITKDTIYASLVMMFTVFVWELVVKADRLLNGRAADNGIGIRQRTWIPAYLVLTVLLLLFRNNSIYAWILYLAVVSIVLYGKYPSAPEEYREFCRKIGWAHAAALLLYLGLNTWMIAAVHASGDTYAREMFSVPAQQIARVTAYHEEELTRTDEERLSVVWGDGNLPEYVPAVADRSKRDITGSSQVIKAFLSEWESLGVRYPGEYVKAFLLKSKGMWYLEDSSYLDDIYSYARGYLQISYPSDQQEYIEVLVPGYHRHQKLQIFQAAYRYFGGGDALWKYVPPLALIMQPAFYCWMLFYYGVCCIGLKKYKWLIPPVYIAALFGTLLFGPCVLVRYVYPIMLSITVLVLLALYEMRA